MPNRVTLAVGSLCALLLGVSSPASAQSQIVEVGLRFWSASPEIALSTNGLTGVGLNNVDFVQEFGLEDTRFREFRASVGRGHKLRVSHVTFAYEASANIQRTIVFQGRTFTVGAPATTDVEWDLWTFGYEWDFLNNEGGFLGVVADLKYNRVKASIESPALTSAATTDVTAPVPTFGVVGRGYLGQAASVTAEFTGLSISRDTFEGKFYDFDVYGTVHLGKFLGVQGGYRSVDAHYLVDGDSGDLKMTGPYIGGVLRF